MDDSRKIFRFLQMVSRLRSPLGSTKDELSHHFGLSRRTVERYFVLVRDLGFLLTQREGRYRIESVDKRCLEHEHLIVFTLEEAAVLREALLAQPLKPDLHRGLLDKLYALTELDELSETLYKQTVARHIAIIRQAIRQRQQLWLRHYQSMSSGAERDYLTEPIRFSHYFRYLMAYDVHAGMVKQFKCERIGGVENTGTAWQFAHEHEVRGVDAFGLTGLNPVKVKLRLSRLAHHLLEEEYPEAAPYVRMYKGQVTWFGPVYRFEGIGRFVLGLPGQIEVLGPKAFKAYLHEQQKKILW
ncbi:MAG TPA: WYL domain-containing protein [Bacteroidales bacterium]|nr:WYL domain-containing protein [Bacteroidales bacterium]